MTTIHEDSAAYTVRVNLQLHNGGGSSHPAMPSAGLPQEVTVGSHCHHPHRFNESGMGSSDWNVSMVDIHLRKLLWVYCPGHSGMKGNDRSDRLAGKATLTSSLLLGRSATLRSLRHYMRVQSQGYHTIDHLEERGVERGSARRSSLKGRERAIVNQTNTGTVSKATLGKLLRDSVERIWAFPCTYIPPSTELN